MRSLILSRLRTFVPTLLLITLLSFMLRVIIPGGPADALLGRADNPETIRMINERYGLDDPMWLQYLRWLGNVLTGDLGTSFASGLPVTSVIGPRIASTVEVVVLGLLFALVVGGGLGLYAAIRSRSRIGALLFAVSGLGVSVPLFWLATMCAGVLGATLHILPVNGYTPISDGLVPHAKSLLMPVVLIAIPSTALMIRHVRSSMVSALASPYVRTAWAMGIDRRRIYFDLALRNALGPVITFIPFLVSMLVGELVVIDVVFVLPGLGSAIIDAVHFRDYAVLQSIVLILAVAVITLSLFADLILTAIDPRRRKEFS